MRSRTTTAHTSRRSLSSAACARFGGCPCSAHLCDDDAKGRAALERCRHRVCLKAARKLPVQPTVLRTPVCQPLPSFRCGVGNLRRSLTQDAEHQRETRDLRAQLAAAEERIRLLEVSATGELATLTTVVTATGDAVATMSNRLTSVEQDVGRLRQEPAASQKKGTARHGAAGASRTGSRSAASPGAHGVVGKRAVPRSVPSSVAPSRGKRSKVARAK